MIFLFLTLTSLLQLHNNPKIDTIDYWHVKYNDKTIAEYTAFDKAPIRIKRSVIKDDDMLSVLCGDDSPCSDCKTSLYILGNNKKRITITTGKGRDLLKIYLNQILATKIFYHLKNVDFYYLDNRRDNFIFRLTIE